MLLLLVDSAGSEEEIGLLVIPIASTGSKTLIAATSRSLTLTAQPPEQK